MSAQSTDPEFSREQVAAALGIAAAVGETIRELGEVPSGHLWARLMGHIDIEQYEAVIRTLKRAGLVTESNHLLKWVGPKKGS